MTIHETTQKGACILAISGRLDFPSRDEIQEAIKTALASGSTHIILNLRNVTFIDSSGLGILLLASKDCKKSKVRLSLCQAQNYVQEVLALGKINTQIPIHDSLEAALA